MLNTGGVKLKINKLLSKANPASKTKKLIRPTYTNSEPEFKVMMEETDKYVTRPEKTLLSNNSIQHELAKMSAKLKIPAKFNVNEAKLLIKDDDVKRRIEGARIFFGRKESSFSCYSITNIEPCSESIRIGAKDISCECMSARDDTKSLLESSTQEKKILFHHAASNDVSQDVNLQVESIQLQNKCSKVISVEPRANIKKESIVSPTNEGKLVETLNALEGR